MIEYCPICRCSHVRDRHLNSINLNYAGKLTPGNKLKKQGSHLDNGSNLERPKRKDNSKCNTSI